MEFSTREPGTGSSFGEWFSDVDRPLAWRGLGWTAADWTDLGSSARGARVAQAATPAGTGTPDRCAELTRDFTISLKEVVKAGCEPSNEQLAKLMDNPVGNLVLVFNQFD